MKTILSVIMAIATINTAFATTSLTNELANYIVENKSKVLEIAKKEYHYTYYSFPIKKEDCIAKSSPVGPVGVCLVTALANEENAIAYFAINVKSDYYGTGEKDRKLSITLIDYEI